MCRELEFMPADAAPRRVSLASVCVCALLAVRAPMTTAAEVPEAPASLQPLSFQTDVMAVLSKAGCNMGVCHGNKNGKGGFKLSLRGEDPSWDFSVLSHDQTGRRINLLQPEQSLILLKATMQVPHEGGRRVSVAS